MSPQFTYDNQGNAVGVFLPIEDWNQIKDGLSETNGLPDWQKEILDHRMMLIQQNPDSVVPMEDFIAEMEKEANKSVQNSGAGTG